MSREIPFTQYVAPTGRAKPTSIEVANDVADKADVIIARGLTFEVEILSNGQVSATITDPERCDMDIVVVPNGPGVREAIEAMIRRFHIPPAPVLPTAAAPPAVDEQPKVLGRTFGKEF
jgi:hypothetical protein